MLTPAFGQTPDQGSQDNQPTASEAQHLVPALVSLTRALDSNSVHTGDQFRATLTGNVHLNGGLELRHGDALLGQVADDDNTAGKSHLAIRFTQAAATRAAATSLVQVYRGDSK